MALLHVKQLFLGNVTSVNPAFTNVYTVPAGDRVVLREVSVRNLNGGAAVTYYVKVNAVLVHTVILGNGGTSAGSDDWKPWIVLEPADVLALAVSAAAGVGAVVSGSLYTI